MSDHLYISKVMLEGFKGYREKQVVELSPYLNVIIGSSDTGKSAFIHAIRWAVRNLPIGNAFIHTECDRARVRVKMSDGHVVTRMKSKGGGSADNAYSVLNRKKNRTLFEAVGKDVPKEVQAATQMDPVVLSDSPRQVVDLNFALQHDPLFLVFSASSSLRSKVLGVLTGAEVVDRAITILNRLVEKLRAERKVVEARRAEWEEKDRVLIDPDPLLEKLGEVKRLSSRLGEVQESVRAIYDYTTAREEALYYKRKVDATSAIGTRLSGAYSRIQDNIQALNRLDGAEEALSESGREVLTAEQRYKVSRVRSRTARALLNDLVGSLDVCPYSHQALPDQCREVLQKG